MNPIKEVKFGKDAKEPLINGVNVVCDAVSSTMGYRGRTMLIEDGGGKPSPTKDGVSVAKAIFLDNPNESLGAEFVKEACNKTVNQAGDGTTSTAVLTQEFVKLSQHAISMNASPIDLKNEIENAKDEVIEYLKHNSVEVDDDYIKDVAKISSNNDEELGSIIAEAFLKAGKNGVVSYEDSDTSTTYVESINGMPIDRGYDIEFFNNVPEKRCVEFKDSPYVLLSNRNIQSLQDILPILEFTNKEKKPLLIVSEMEHQVLKTLYTNAKQGLKVAVISPPAVAEKRMDYLSDIALATNAMVLDIDTGDNIATYEPKQLLGVCSSLTVTKENTILFFDEMINAEAIDKRMTDLNKVIENSHSDLEKKYLGDRVAKLSCGVSVVKVGASTESELKEKTDRVDDAIHAVRAALAEGVVEGGGTALVNASRILPEEKEGYRLVKEAILAPFKTILDNAGVEYSEILPMVSEKLGYDVKEYRLCDMIESGIIDPVKVVRCALENSVSAANTLLMTDGTITFKRSN